MIFFGSSFSDTDEDDTEGDGDKSDEDCFLGFLPFSSGTSWSCGSSGSKHKENLATFFGASPQCGNFTIFLSFRFYVKTILKY